MAEDLIERAAQALWEFEQGALGKSASGPFPEHERAMWVGRARTVLDASGIVPILQGADLYMSCHEGWQDDHPEIRRAVDEVLTALGVSERLEP